MVSAQLTDRTPNLIPVPPAWLERQRGQAPASQNININDIYWAKPDGWIVTGPSAIPGGDGRPLTRQAESLMRRGWTPLIEYSYTDRVSSKTGQRETIETNADRLNSPDRYYWLFVNGGAHLFPIEQIVEHHWHITPPYGLPLSVFPQLDEWEVPAPYFCPACPAGRPNKNSAEEVTQHLMVQHQMTLVQVRDLQEATRNFTDEPRGSSGLLLRRKAQSMEGTQPSDTPSPTVSTARLIICNDCGEQFPDGLAKARHVKSTGHGASSTESREDPLNA
jgi:hypothetical protein